MVTVNYLLALFLRQISAWDPLHFPLISPEHPSHTKGALEQTNKIHVNTKITHLFMPRVYPTYTPGTQYSGCLQDPLAG